MSSRVPGWRSKAVCGVISMVCAGLLSPVFAQEPPAAPQAGNPARTNLVRINRLQKLEDDITRTLKNMLRRNTMENAVPGPLSPAVNLNPQKPRSEQNNWMLMDPDELGKAQKADDMRNLLNGGEGDLKELSPRDQFLKDFLQPNTGKNDSLGKPADSMNPFQAEKGDQSAEDLLGRWRKNSGETDRIPQELRKSEENLINLLRETRGDSLSSFGGARPKSVPELFQAPSSSQPGLSRRENPYLEEYRKLLALPPAVNTDPVRAAMQDAFAPSQAPVLPGDLGDTKPVRKDLLGPQFGSINPVFTPQAPADPNEHVLNSWNPLYTPAAPVQTVRQQPAPLRPSFEPPRRKF